MDGFGVSDPRTPRRRAYDDPEVERLRAHLKDNNGIRGLEICSPDEVERVVRIFRRDGSVVVRDLLDKERLRRFREGSARTLRQLLEIPGAGKSKYMAQKNGEPSTGDRASEVRAEDLDLETHQRMVDFTPPMVTINFAMTDLTWENGPIRQIPGSHTWQMTPLPPNDEPEWMRLSTLVGAPAGAGVFRDNRAWHGGTPNLSREIRALPNVEYGAP